MQFVQILDILFFDMKEIQDVEDVSDESETDSFIEQIYLTRPDTKSQRIVKTFLINFSFIALVSEKIHFKTSYDAKSLYLIFKLKFLT